MATNLRNRLESQGSILSNLDGKSPTGTNNGAVINGLTPVNNTFENGTYQDTLLASGAFNVSRTSDPTNPGPRTGGL
jgi:hypothetical protein